MGHRSEPKDVAFRKSDSSLFSPTGANSGEKMVLGHRYVVDRHVRVCSSSDSARSLVYNKFAIREQGIVGGRSEEKMCRDRAGSSRLPVVDPASSRSRQDFHSRAEHIYNDGRFGHELGVQIGCRRLAGVWSAEQLTWHINRKELFTVFISLSKFKEVLKGKSEMLQSDNKTVVAYLKNQGGTRSIVLLEATRKLLILVDALQVNLLPFYIPGRYNSIVDCLSRGRDLPDWHLSCGIIEIIFKKWGVPQIDLFASYRSKIVPNYVTLDAKDSAAVFTNAFSQDWK